MYCKFSDAKEMKKDHHEWIKCEKKNSNQMESKSRFGCSENAGTNEMKKKANWFK